MVSVYLCPSDGEVGDGLLTERSDGDSSDVNVNRAVTNYKACSGNNLFSGTAWANTSPTGRWANDNNVLIHCNGVICSNSQDTVPSDPLIVRANTIKLDSITDGLSNTFAIGETLPATTAWAWWYCNNGTVATCAIPLNNRWATYGTSAGVQDWRSNWGFSSAHPDGGGFSMCDGSVTFISNNIDLNVYHSIATVDAGEIHRLQ